MAERSIIALAAAGFGSLTSKTSGMGMVTTFGGPAREITGVGWPREPFAGAWQRNVTVEPPANLLTYAPVYACVTRIANDIAKLGLRLLMEVDAEPGIFEPAPKTSPFWAVVRRPNSLQNRIQFVRQWLLSKLVFGNAYGLKFRDARGVVQAVYLLNPRLVQPVVTPDGGVYYSLGGDALSRIPNGMGAVPADEIIHDRGPTIWHPLCGVPPLFACALSGTLGLKIQRNSVAFFENMSRPSGLLKAPGEIDEPTAERWKQQWQENLARGNLGKIAVLGNGLDYVSIAATAEASQLAEQLGLTAVDVATAFGMPAYKINQGPMPTNNNVQALNQQYYSDCLQTHIEDIELLLEEGLEIPDTHRIEFDLEGLLRMDSLTQMDVLVKGVGGMIFKTNEARKRLNLRGVTGGDTVLSQQQYFSLGAIDKRDQSPDPFSAGKAAPAAAPSPAPAPEPAPPAPAKTLDADLLEQLRTDAAAARTLLADVATKAAGAVDAAIERAAAAPPAPVPEPAPAAAESMADLFGALVEQQREANAQGRTLAAEVTAQMAATMTTLLDRFNAAAAPPAQEPEPELDGGEFADALVDLCATAEPVALDG